MAEIKEIWFNSNKVGRKSFKSSQPQADWSLSLLSNRHNHKGLASKNTPTPCRMAPSRRAGRTPALPYPPWWQEYCAIHAGDHKALNSKVLYAKP